MATIKMTRRQLYDLMWERPMSAFIKDYGITYLEVKNLLEKYKIPVPANGHWSKLKAGLYIEKIPLPDHAGLDEKIYYEPKEVKKRVPKSDKQKMISSSLRKGPDSIIVKARKIFEGRAKGRSKDILIKIASESININVSPAILDRALLFMDLLISSVREHGGDVRVEPHSTFLRIDGEDFFAALREKQNRIERKEEGYSFSFHDFVGSGLLIFKIGEQSWCSKEWSDTSFVPIEDKIDVIVDYLKIAAKKEKQDREERRLRKIEEEKARLVKEDMEKRRKVELNRFIKLKQLAERWEAAEKIRKYLDEMERSASGDEKQVEYISWARKKLEWYNPLIEHPDELLEEVDRDTLTVIKKWGW